MGILIQSATSTQPVQQVVNVPEGVDPTSDQVFMAFVPVPNYGQPSMPAGGSGLWNTAAWETDTNPTVYWASCLVGPANSGVVLAVAKYLIAVRVVDNPAVPALWGWTLIVT